MSNIVVVISSFGTGGAQRVCNILVNELINRKYKITLIIFKKVNTTIEAKLLTRVDKFINFNTVSTTKSFLPMLRYLKKNKDITILAFGHQIAILAYIIKAILNNDNLIISRNISTLSEARKVYGTFFSKYFVTLITKILYRKIDKVIAQSQNMAEDLIQNYGLNKDKIHVIHNPIIKPQETKNISKKNYILFVGTMRKEKGVVYLANVFNRIHKYQNIDLYIVGPNGDDTDIFKELISSYNLTSYVKYLGEHDHDSLSKFYLEAKLTILTSIFEGLPNVLIESISHGTPIVSFDTPSGPSEIIQNGINGYLCKYLDVNDMTKNILLTLDTTWDKKNIIATSEKFAVKKIINQYIKVIIE